MKISDLTPMLWTNELEESIQFYTEVLSFEIGEFNPEWQWASLHNGAIELMLSKPPAEIKNIGFSGSFYLKVEDVDAWWEKLKDNQRIVYELDNFDWGMREFALYDNNGYILQIGSPID